MSERWGVEAPDGFVYEARDYQDALDIARDRHLTEDDIVFRQRGGGDGQWTRAG